jgi:hypothetical protein
LPTPRKVPINVDMATITENPIFHVILADGDEWAIEVE